jgi:hypothetical protein
MLLRFIAVNHRQSSGRDIITVSHHAGGLMDLSKLNLAELKDLQAQIGAEMKNREKSEIEKARNDINAIA